MGKREKKKKNAYCKANQRALATMRAPRVLVPSCLWVRPNVAANPAQPRTKEDGPVRLPGPRLVQEELETVREKTHLQELIIIIRK